jgi:hypothetical protein
MQPFEGSMYITTPEETLLMQKTSLTITRMDET